MNHKCSVKDGKFVQPCDTLRDTSDGHAMSRAGGIKDISYTNMKTGNPSRRFFFVKSGEHKKKGIALNFCPFCGTRIDAPFLDEGENT